MTSNFSLYDLLIKNEIRGLIFDKFGQKNQFRLFPTNQQLYGSFEAYVDRNIDIRYQTKKLEHLVLTPKDNQIILFAFLHRDSYGVADGMGDVNRFTNIARFSLGTKENNYVFDNKTLLELYNKIDQLKEEKIPLPKELQNILSISMDFCYFDKSPITGLGSICKSCAEELRNEGYDVSNSLIANSKRIK